MIERTTDTLTKRAAKMKAIWVGMTIMVLLPCWPKSEDDGARQVAVRWTGVGRLHSVLSPENDVDTDTLQG